MKKWFYECGDIMKIIGVKEGKAYKIIRKLNEELREKGFLTQQGRVNAKYFNERYNIGQWFLCQHIKMKKVKNGMFLFM